jgi:hypothetical protein
MLLRCYSPHSFQTEFCLEVWDFLIQRLKIVSQAYFLGASVDRPSSLNIRHNRIYLNKVCPLDSSRSIPFDIMTFCSDKKLILSTTRSLRYP